MLSPQRAPGAPARHLSGRPGCYHTRRGAAAPAHPQAAVHVESICTSSSLSSPDDSRGVIRVYAVYCQPACRPSTIGSLSVVIILPGSVDPNNTDDGSDI